MQHLSHSSRRHQSISGKFCGCQDQVRFFALHRIKPHAPRLCGPPSIHLSFNLAAVLPRRSTQRVSSGSHASRAQPPSRHRLRRGLPGYLILFAPHAFAPERQSSSRGPPSPPVFLQISTHFTATPGILPPSTRLKLASIRCSSQVEPGDFTSDLTNRLRALYAQ